MERNYDEVIAGMLMQLDNMQTRFEEAEVRFEKLDKRMDLTIKRMVKAESRLELVDRKLEQSIQAHKKFFAMQSKINKHFLGLIRKHL
jgi:hypothetical protein